jgi:hypothetical protein
MGQLVEYPIKTLFNGVSRQPHPVRLPSQIEEGDNALPSVVTGGFEKRPATRHVAKLTGLSDAFEYALHVIDRDASEKYAVIVGNSTLKVYDLQTGATKTVNAMAADAVTYLNGAPHDYAFVTVADYTFVVNKNVVVAMSAATAGAVTGTVQTFTKLPAAPAVNDLYHVQGDDSSTFDDYYVKWDGTVWKESVNPNGQNSFDATTMPYQLVRNVDGTFTFQKATWTSRPVGDATIVPAPPFVGKTINDIVFFRGRLGIISDENPYYGQAGDVFNMWPDKAFTVEDSDPVEQAASTNQVSILRHALPFRKALFLTADSVQFEASAVTKFTPKDNSLDVTTSYQMDSMAKPVSMGDQLYFIGKTEGASVVYEYFYDANQFSNTATDVTKHIRGYLPPSIRMLSASTLTSRLFILPDLARNHLYVYTSYWDGVQKVQSAWTRYIFGDTENDAYIYGHAVIADLVYILIDRAGEVCLEKFAVDTEGNDPALGFIPLYDRRVQLTGVYDAVNGWTTWTLPYSHHNVAQVLLGGAFTNQIGRILNVTYPTATTVRAVGDFSAGTAYIGIKYQLYGELSRQYLRDQNNSSLVTGRLQMREITFSFRDTGYFEVHVMPEARTTRVWKFTGRILGSTANAIGVPALESLGTYRVKVASRADTVKIAIVNDSPYPSVITGAAWTGFYNNLARQG